MRYFHKHLSNLGFRRGVLGFEPNPAVMGWEVGYTLSTSPVHDITNTEKRMSTHTHMMLSVNLKWQINPIPIWNVEGYLNSQRVTLCRIRSMQLKATAGQDVQLGIFLL